MAYKYESKLYTNSVVHSITENIFIETGETKEIKEVYNKARAFDELKKHIDEEVDSYMALYRQTKDPTYSLLNSHYDTLLGYIEELEREQDD